ncbi:hypothetical protein M011DRAFT_436584 [Sporormia fimetaria CBS 119925]|uniref:Ubiquitin-domain-containing protein n=1 Tax=Sporormia fimetaria CBS 119925 TaxID=1340428 RepID=A0A6A6VP21_9PLEO|nr:hypothetical protein M011DRAFT_436584 [Sporormia fimetaria CBS 119925]
MADDASTSADEAHITFNVKAANDKKLAVTIAASATVADLKAKLASPDMADVPPERQRLIYSGRVLKDPDTLAGVKIKDGHTVHLVKGAASSQPANQGTASGTTGGAAPIPQIPTNMAAGTGNNPLAGLTGARYAGFHGLPGADMFGPDGGMGPPPGREQMLEMMQDPNFLSQMNEAMDNPQVIEMLSQNPMIRGNPMLANMLRNPEMRRLLFNPEMMRLQLQMSRGMEGGNASAMAMPGETDTTPQQNPTSQTSGSTGTGQPTGAPSPPPANPFASLFGAPPASAGQQQPNPMAEMTRQMMQNPEALRAAMNMFSGGAPANQSMGSDSTGTTSPPPNPFASLLGGGMDLGGFGSPPPQDNRPPEEVYEVQLRQLNEMGFYEFDRNVAALRRSGGNVQGAIEHLLGGS